MVEGTGQGEIGIGDRDVSAERANERTVAIVVDGIAAPLDRIGVHIREGVFAVARDREVALRYVARGCGHVAATEAVAVRVRVERREPHRVVVVVGQEVAVLVDVRGVANLPGIRVHVGAGVVAVVVVRHPTGRDLAQRARILRAVSVVVEVLPIDGPIDCSDVDRAIAVVVYAIARLVRFRVHGAVAVIAVCRSVDAVSVVVGV